MKWCSLFLCLVVFVACRREKVASQWVYTPPSPVDCGVATGQVVLEGSYQGKNVYVQNPFASCTDTTIKFCTESVTINDSISLPKDSLAMTCYRIPLTSYGFKEGDKIRIVIKHYGDCTPKVLNPEVH